MKPALQRANDMGIKVNDVLARDLFNALQDSSFDGVGITRDAYGPGEQRAHDLIADMAADFNLEIKRDAALNLYVTLPGADRAAPVRMTGSHLDSVPAGGNYDGAAGVVAGMSVLAACRQAGIVPPVDLTVMGIRAEESTWFPYSYLGSKAAFGMVDRGELSMKRQDTGRSLADHIADCGGNPNDFGSAWLNPTDIERFVELHIEQGPVLVEANLPVGVVTGIRGSFRYRDACILGEYAHSGATPRLSRRDAVRAAALWIAAVDADWAEWEKLERDLVITFGKISTNPLVHAFSKVSGQVDLCVDVRSLEAAFLEEMDVLMQRRLAEVAQRTGVTAQLGDRSGSMPAKMDATLQVRMMEMAKMRSIGCRLMASGAGHDAAVFAQRGIATGMIFVRNACGSHNPNEKMDLDDFTQGAQLLADVLLDTNYREQRL